MPAKTRESGAGPKAKNWIPAFAGMSGRSLYVLLLRSARHALLRPDEALGKQCGCLVLELEVGDQPAVGVLLHDELEIQIVGAAEQREVDDFAQRAAVFQVGHFFQKGRL